MKCEVAVIGAGPYGLAAAAHLRAAGVDAQVFGEAMEFWDRRMPTGMFLRSSWDASHISDPGDQLSLDRFQQTIGTAIPKPIPLAKFVEYGRWFQRNAIPDADCRNIRRLSANGAFQLCTYDGEPVKARRVVIAVGIASYAEIPSQFEHLLPTHVSHSSTQCDLSQFAGRTVAVIGGGQSAIESAALLKEAGAQVEVFIREPGVIWLRGGLLHSDQNPIRKLLYPSSDIGPPGLNQFTHRPALFRCFPRSLQDKIAYRCIRPAAAAWLHSRVQAIPLTTGREVVGAMKDGQGVKLKLNDGSSRLVDHVLLATGYRVDISRCSFIAPEVLRLIRQRDGYPELDEGFQSSVPGLHFVGAPAARTFGPLMRFVAGTGYAARALTRHIKT